MTHFELLKIAHTPPGDLRPCPHHVRLMSSYWVPVPHTWGRCMTRVTLFVCPACDLVIEASVDSTGRDGLPRYSYRESYRYSTAVHPRRSRL